MGVENGGVKHFGKPRGLRFIRGQQKHFQLFYLKYVQLGGGVNIFHMFKGGPQFCFSHLRVGSEVFYHHCTFQSICVNHVI